MSYSLRNNWNYLGDDSWDCDIYVEASNAEEMNRLVKAKYVLDIPDDNPINVVRSVEDGFKFRTRCSGVLSVSAFIYFDSGKTQRLLHEIEVAYDPPSGISRPIPHTAREIPKGTIRFTTVRRYKYRLCDDYKIKIEILDHTVDTPFISLSPEGELTIRKGYAWDGPSGPTIDTKSFMRGSLVHDALYQLIRTNHIPIGYREYADSLLKVICLEDGMGKFRAWYMHQAVRMFGEKMSIVPMEYNREVYIAP